jgi:hypothetical protein
MKETTPPSNHIKLGRNDYSEFEYNLKFKPGVNGKYGIALTSNNIGIETSDGVPIQLNNDGPNGVAAVVAKGIQISKTNLNVIEGTTQDSYQVNLTYEPSAKVDICLYHNSDSNLKVNTPASGDLASTVCPDKSGDGLSLAEHALTFNPGSGWNDPQTVSISYDNDNLIEGTRTYQINPFYQSDPTTIVFSADASYNHMFIRPVNVNVTDYGSTSSNVRVNICGETTLTPPFDFSFPDLVIGHSETHQPNFSPAIPITINDIGNACGQSTDFALHLQASPFCMITDPTKCLPLKNIYLTTSDLHNNGINSDKDDDSVNGTFFRSEINQFMSRYISNGDTGKESGFKDTTSLPAQPLGSDAAGANNIRVFDVEDMPDFSTLGNKLTGAINFSLHLMIDYAQITNLSIGTYSTTLTLDFIRR